LCRTNQGSQGNYKHCHHCGHYINLTLKMLLQKCPRQLELSACFGLLGWCNNEQKQSYLCCTTQGSQGNYKHCYHCGHYINLTLKIPLVVGAFVLALASLGDATIDRINSIFVAPPKEAKAITNTATIVAIIAISL
jgi:hypothetical protein